MAELTNLETKLREAMEGSLTLAAEEDPNETA